MKFLLSFFSVLFFLNISAQQNYEWLKIKKFRVAKLSDSLRETSGLKFIDGKLYTINDGGNTSEVFEINKNNGKIVNKIDLKVQNFDWEAITNDSTYIYVADFGNNWGIRKDLKIYKVPFGSVVSASSANNAQDIQEIKYHYPEQTEFIKKPQNNNWDAESMIFKNGNLHVFTKEWQSYNTAHYKISPNKTEEIQNAEKLETHKLGYLATDASYFNNKLYIIGYTKKMEVWLTVFNEDENDLFFNSNPKKYYLGQTSKLGQIEGIAVNEDGIYISGEQFLFKFLKAPQSLYFIPKNKLPKSLQ